MGQCYKESKSGILWEKNLQYCTQSFCDWYQEIRCHSGGSQFYQWTIQFSAATRLQKHLYKLNNMTSGSPTDALSRKWFACKIAAFMSYPPLSTFSKKRRIEVYDCRYRVILCFEKNPTTACDIILCLSLDSETIFKALIKYIRKRQKWSCVEWNLLWHSLPVFLTFSRWEKVIIYESLSTLPKSLCLLPAISIERSSLV